MWPYGEASCDQSLVAWYRLQETSGVTVADSTAFANHGTSVRDTSLMTVAGKFGTALSFNGSTDVVTIPFAFTFTNFSLLFWIFPNIGIAAGSVPLGSGLAENFYVQLIQKSGTFFNIIMYLNGADNSYLWGQFSFIIPEGLWSHVAFTMTGVDTSTGKIYVNGRSIPVNTNSFSAPAAATELYCGRRADTFNDFSGFMDDLRLYNRALTDSEIKILAMRGR